MLFRSTYINPAVMNYLLGTKIKIISGYQAVAEVNNATEKRETDASFTTWNDIGNTHADWVRDGKVRILAQIALAKHRALPDVPLLAEWADNDADRAVIEFMASSSQMGQSFVAPAGAPAPIVEALRRAFDATMQDPEFRGMMQGARLEISAMKGEALQGFVERTMAAPAAVVARYKAATAAE